MATTALRTTSSSSMLKTMPPPPTGARATGCRHPQSFTNSALSASGLGKPEMACTAIPSRVPTATPSSSRPRAAATGAAPAIAARTATTGPLLSTQAAPSTMRTTSTSTAAATIRAAEATVTAGSPSAPLQNPKMRVLRISKMRLSNRSPWRLCRLAKAYKSKENKTVVARYGLKARRVYVPDWRCDITDSMACSIGNPAGVVSRFTMRAFSPCNANDGARETSQVLGTAQVGLSIRFLLRAVYLPYNCFRLITCVALCLCPDNGAYKRHCMGCFPVCGAR